MGSLFKTTHEYLKLDPLTAQDEMFVEIGTNRGEGSTDYFAWLAKEHNRKFVTVDIIDHTAKNQDQDLIKYDCGMGSQWAKNIFPSYGKKISCLYLDNFDWNWYADKDATDFPAWIHHQIDDYKKMGVEMNNLNCQVEHLQQIIALLPHMADTSYIILDDTYLVKGCYIGKSGAAVPYLLINGYAIIQSMDYGILLSRVAHDQK